MQLRAPRERARYRPKGAAAGPVILELVWDYAASAESWVGVGSGGPNWNVNHGQGDGGWEAFCTSFGSGCSFSARPFQGANRGFYYDGTWESAGVPVGATVIGLNTSGTYAKMKKSSNHSGTLRTGVLRDNLNAEIWRPFGSPSLTTNWVTYESASYETDETGLSIPSSDNFQYAIGYEGSIPNKTLGSQRVYLDEAGLSITYE